LLVIEQQLESGFVRKRGGKEGMVWVAFKEKRKRRGEGM